MNGEKLPLKNTQIDNTKLTIDNVNIPKNEINKLYDSLFIILENRTITTLNIVLIATALMQLVEKSTKLTGIKKKILVTHVLKKYIRDNLEGEEEEAIIIFIDTFLPSVIDTLISIDKKEFAIKIHKGLNICFPFCK